MRAKTVVSEFPRWLLLIGSLLIPAAVFAVLPEVLPWRGWLVATVGGVLCFTTMVGLQLLLYGRRRPVAHVAQRHAGGPTPRPRRRSATAAAARPARRRPARRVPVQ